MGISSHKPSISGYPHDYGNLHTYQIISIYTYVHNYGKNSQMFHDVPPQLLISFSSGSPLIVAWSPLRDSLRHGCEPKPHGDQPQTINTSGAGEWHEKRASFCQAPNAQRAKMKGSGESRELGEVPNQVLSILENNSGSFNRFQYQNYQRTCVPRIRNPSARSKGPGTLDGAMVTHEPSE